MKKIDRDSHKILASELEWDELALTIMEIEAEILEFGHLITKKELKEREQTLEIYEKEKSERVKKSKVYGPKSYLIYGQDFVSCWNYDDDPYF